MRVLTWAPNLAAGKYKVRAMLIYDLNRYNDPKFTEDQTILNDTSLCIEVAQGVRQ